MSDTLLYVVFFISCLLNLYFLRKTSIQLVGFMAKDKKELYARILILEHKVNTLENLLK